MRGKQEKSPHRLEHEELSLCMPVDLKTLGKGDVCIRQGAPHMVVEPPAAIPKEEGQVWVCNLQTGSAWPASGSEQVHPALDVKLSLRTARRGELS